MEHIIKKIGIEKQTSIYETMIEMFKGQDHSKIIKRVQQLDKVKLIDWDYEDEGHLTNLLATVSPIEDFINGTNLYFKEGTTKEDMLEYILRELTGEIEVFSTYGLEYFMRRVEKELKKVDPFTQMENEVLLWNRVFGDKLVRPLTIEDFVIVEDEIIEIEDLQEEKPFAEKGYFIQLKEPWKLFVESFDYEDMEPTFYAYAGKFRTVVENSVEPSWVNMKINN